MVEHFNKFIDELVDHLVENEVLFSVPGYYWLGHEEVRKALKDFAVNGKSDHIQELRDELERRAELFWKERQSQKRPAKRANMKGYVYLIESNGLVKIGRAKDIKNRLRAYTTENPHGIRPLAYALVEDAGTKELELHEHFAIKRRQGEWFDLTAEETKTAIAMLV